MRTCHSSFVPRIWLTLFLTSFSSGAFAVPPGYSRTDVHRSQQTVEERRRAGDYDYNHGSEAGPRIYNQYGRGGDSVTSIDPKRFFRPGQTLRSSNFLFTVQQPFGSASGVSLGACMSEATKQMDRNLKKLVSTCENAKGFYFLGIHPRWGLGAFPTGTPDRFNVEFPQTFQATSTPHELVAVRFSSKQLTVKRRPGKVTFDCFYYNDAGRFGISKGQHLLIEEEEVPLVTALKEFERDSARNTQNKLSKYCEEFAPPGFLGWRAAAGASLQAPDGVAMRLVFDNFGEEAPPETPYQCIARPLYEFSCSGLIDQSDGGREYPRSNINIGDFDYPVFWLWGRPRPAESR